MTDSPHSPRAARFRSVPDPLPETADTAALLDRAELHLHHFAAVFDAIALEAWRATPPSAAITPRPADAAPDAGADAPDAPPRGTTLLEALCFLRDEEAWAVGRRVALMYQETAPAFEHLTLAMARAHGATTYDDAAPGRAFGDLFAHRMAWLQLARAEAPLLATRRARLPPEEGGDWVDFHGLVRRILDRDRAACRFVLALRAAVGT